MTHSVTLHREDIFYSACDGEGLVEFVSNG